MVQERNKTVAKKKGDTISMDPAVAEAFYASTKVSRKYYKRDFSHSLRIS